MAIQINRNENFTQIAILPDHKARGIAFFITLIFSGFIYMFIQSILNIISGDFHLAFLPFFILFFYGAYVNFFNMYWITIGDEIIKIDNQVIRITKKVFFISSTKRFSLDRIKNIKLKDHSAKYGAAGTAMFGLSNINVLFSYGRKKKMIGKQINEQEGQEIINELERWKYAT